MNIFIKAFASDTKNYEKKYNWPNIESFSTIWNPRTSCNLKEIKKNTHLSMSLRSRSLVTFDNMERSHVPMLIDKASLLHNIIKMFTLKSKSAYVVCIVACRTALCLILYSPSNRFFQK